MAKNALTVLAEAMATVGRLRQMNQGIGSAEFSAVLAALQVELSETKLRIADLVFENAELRTQISTLHKAEGADVDMTFDGFVYRMANDLGAYCPNCFESERKAIHLLAVSTPLDRAAT